MALAKEYIASDINTKINISDEYIVLTRDNLDEDSLNKLNVSKEYLEEVMYNDNIYYIIAKENISNEIIVVVPENKLPFKNLKPSLDLHIHHFFLFQNGGADLLHCRCFLFLQLLVL